MKRFLYALGFILAAACAPRAAQAACSPVPYTFVDNVSFLTASTTNANNQALYQCATNVDNTQIGASGIYASQIIPTSAAQATFGGSQSYTFTKKLNANGGIATTGLVPAPVPTPNSSSTIITFGDSLAYGATGPTSCKSAQNQPNSVAAASLTGTCWSDLIGASYGAHVINLGVGGALLTSGPGSAISRYNASYTCTSGGAPSPTSGLFSICNQGQTLPALDSLVGPNTFVILQQSGHNDAKAAPLQAFYSVALADYLTIANDLIAHGQPANQIIFTGAPMGGPPPGNYSGSANWPSGNYDVQMTQDLAYTAAAASASLQVGASFVDMFVPFSTAVNYPGSVLYDALHPNDSTNCSGSGCSGGSAVWATQIENVVGSTANTYQGAYAILGGLFLHGNMPMYDSTGNNLLLGSGQGTSTSAGIISTVTSPGVPFVFNATGASVPADLVDFQISGTTVLNWNKSSGMTDNGNFTLPNNSGSSYAFGMTNASGTMSQILDSSNNWNLNWNGTPIVKFNGPAGSLITGSTSLPITGNFNFTNNSGPSYVQSFTNSTGRWDAFAETANNFDINYNGTNLFKLSSTGNPTFVGGTMTLVGAGGPTLTLGSGAPIGACVNGSLWVRGDGSAGANTTTYDCRGSIWQALTGG